MLCRVSVITDSHRVTQECGSHGSSKSVYEVVNAFSFVEFHHPGIHYFHEMSAASTAIAKAIVYGNSSTALMKPLPSGHTHSWTAYLKSARGEVVFLLD